MYETNLIADDIITAFNAALDYALDSLPEESALEFLGLWREGCWEEIKHFYPDFNINTAKVCGYLP